MLLHKQCISYRIIYFTICALSVLVCLMLSNISLAEPDRVSPPDIISSPIPDDVAAFIKSYRYETAFKRVEILLSQELISPQTGQNLLTRIKKESITHSKTNIQTAYQLSRQYRWADAQTLLSALSTQVLDQEPVSKAKKLVTQSQNKHLLKHMSNTALQKQSWLQQQIELNKVKNRSTQRNLLSRVQKRWTKFKLKRHNLHLLKLALENHEIEEYSTSQRCLEAVDPEQLSGKSKYQFEMLADLSFPGTFVSIENKKPKYTQSLDKPSKNTTIKTNKQNTLNHVNTLINFLEKNMHDNNLLAIRLNLNELALFTSSQSPHKPLINQANAFLKNEIIKLDQAADDLYRTEQPLEAYEIWEFLLQLDSDNTAIQQKFDRAKIVLGNMKALRAQGNTNSLPDIQ